MAWSSSEGSLGLALPFLSPHPKVASFGLGSRAAAIVAAVGIGEAAAAAYVSLALQEPLLLAL